MRRTSSGEPGASWHNTHWGFEVFFEKRAATERPEFADALPADGKELWLYVENDRSLASVAIDGDTDTRIAHLRWFIVDESLRGPGIGRELMTRAMRFVDDQRFRESHLWTFKGLDSARHLYESFGFARADEFEGDQWGSKVTEQRLPQSGKGHISPRSTFAEAPLARLGAQSDTPRALRCRNVHSHVSQAGIAPRVG